MQNKNRQQLTFFLSSIIFFRWRATKSRTRNRVEREGAMVSSMAPPPRSLVFSSSSVIFLLFVSFFLVAQVAAAASKLRFSRRSGEFKVLQVADMHYGNGASTPCLDVLPRQERGCSDLNTTAFLRRLIRTEKPDLIVFTGDNIFGVDSNDSARSVAAAFEPAVTAGIPFAAVLGNHDQEGNLGRRELIKYISSMPGSLARVNPVGVKFSVDGFGNYHIPVAGAAGSDLANKSAFNLYFLDSGDYTSVQTISGYDWIKPSQQLWFRQISGDLRRDYEAKPHPQKGPAPGMAFFHIPLPEFGSPENSIGVRQEGISSASVNSGFFATLAEAGDVKAVLVGHDHLNDFCGELARVQLCYGGGFGYHAYGKAGWPRRSRVVSIYLKKLPTTSWGAVEIISTWKRLDDANLSKIDYQTLWKNSV